MTTVGRLLSLLAGHRRWMAVGAALGFLAVGSNVALMAMSAYLISKAALVTNVAEVALAITAVRVLAIARAAFRYLERYVTHRATFAILADLRVWFFASIEPLAPANLARHRSGDLLGRIVADIETLEDFYIRVLMPPVVAVLVAASAGLLLGIFDPILGLVLLASLALSGIVLPLAARWRSRRPADALISSRAALTATVVDELGGIADLIALDRVAAHGDRVLELGRATDRAIADLAVVRGGTGALTASVASLAAVAILAIGVALVGAGRLDPVYLAVLPLVTLASFEVVAPLAQAFGLLDAEQAAARRLFDLTDAEPDVSDAAVVGAPSGPAQVGYGIEVRGVRFRYADDAPLALDGVDLSIPDGSSLAILGPSGVGKSTLVNLLLRFWDHDDGEIRIGGRDVRELPADEVRRMIGVVPQDIHLFNATIRDNLAVADAGVTDERIVEACRVARIHDVIEALPHGYETRVGENGLLLSGGERQRLAIARAVIKNAPILILDEATANLDVETEAEVVASLAAFMAGRTTLVITHRPRVARAMGVTRRIEDATWRPVAKQAAEPDRGTPLAVAF